jgi:hypothetical protein
MLVGYSFIWTQNSSKVASEVMSEIDFKNQRAAEVLFATTVNSTSINVANPTNLAITITQIWNSTHYLNSTVVTVSAYANKNITGQTSSDGYYKLITRRGNVFYITPISNQTSSTNLYPSKYWLVKYWATNSSKTYNVGNATFYDLSFSVNFVNSSWGVLSVTQFGFNATTIVRPANGANNINVSVSLLSPLIPPDVGNSNFTIALKSLNSTYNQSYSFLTSGYCQFTGIIPSEIYSVQIFTNSSKSQTITVTIVGADFA